MSTKVITTKKSINYCSTQRELRALTHELKNTTTNSKKYLNINDQINKLYLSIIDFNEQFKVTQ